MAKHTRDMPVPFWVSPQETELTRQEMAQFGTDSPSVYLRKMAIDGYVPQLDLPELKELVSLLRRSSNNLSQLTRHAHRTRRFYDADLEDLRRGHECLWSMARHVLPQLFKLRQAEESSLKFSTNFHTVVAGLDLW